jgi:hypothetical protein
MLLVTLHSATEPQTKGKAKRKERELRAKNAKCFLCVRCELFARLAVMLF